MCVVRSSFHTGGYRVTPSILMKMMFIVIRIQLRSQTAADNIDISNRTAYFMQKPTLIPGSILLDDMSMNKVLNLETDSGKFSRRALIEIIIMNCSDLAHQISVAQPDTVLRITNFQCLCGSTEKIDFSVANVTILPMDAQQLSLSSRPSGSIVIAAKGIVFYNLHLVGLWSILIAENCSLTLHKVVLNETKIHIARGGKLMIQDGVVSRTAPSDTALEISGTGALISISDSLIEDGQEGVLLSIIGDDNSLVLSNVTIQSAPPRAVGNSLQTEVAVVGLNVSGCRVHTVAYGMLVRWCGLGGIQFSGCNGSLTIDGGLLVGNRGLGDGGGISVAGPDLAVAVLRSVIRGSLTDNDGGGIAVEGNGSSLLLRGTLLHGNQAGNNGGAVAFRGALGRLEMDSCDVADNLHYGLDGGAVIAQSDGGEVLISNCSFSRNICMIQGGGIAAWAAYVRLVGCVFDGNDAASGGGARIEAPLAEVADCNFTSNTARAGPGGGLSFAFGGPGTAALIVAGSVFEGNFAQDGGGASVQGAAAARVSDCVFVGNVASGAGGGLWYEALNGSADGAGLEVAGTVVRGNAAEGGSGGGLSVVGGLLRLRGSWVHWNAAGASGGGGIALSGSTGFRAETEDADWLVEGSSVAGNEALGPGGGVVVDNTSARLEVVTQGRGLPFALLPGGVSVACRGAGDPQDLSVEAFDGKNGSKTVPFLRGVGNVGDSDAYTFADPEALILAVSTDGAVALTYLNYGFEVMAIRVADGAVLASAAAPAVLAFSPPNETPQVPAAWLPLFSPMIADTDFNNRMTYGGWGMSSAVTDGRIFASTFHHTFDYHVANSSFLELNGCGSGVSAMVYSEATALLHLAQFTGSGVAFRVYTYDPAIGHCSAQAWEGPEPFFLQIRALGVSADGQQLYVAEASSGLEDLTEMQIIKIVDLRSAVTTVIRQSADSVLQFDTVVAIQPVLGKPADLLVLHVPGGLYGVGSNPALTTLFWQLITVGVVVLQVTQSKLEGNSALDAGGAIAVLTSAALQADGCLIGGNSADQLGGGVAILGNAVADLSNCSLEANRAAIGGAIYIEQNAQIRLSKSTMKRNLAADCGGVFGTASSVAISLAGFISFQWNRANASGGVICVRSNQQGQCNNKVNRFMVAVNAGTDTLVKAEGNHAGGGGGVFYDGCTPIESNIPTVLIDSSSPRTISNQSLLESLSDLSGWMFADNSAGYGSVMATVTRETLVFAGSNNKLAYSPGQKSKLILKLIDG